jgi:D-glycero-beta-D-manno-heptose-7-phosphate kinase
MYWKSIFDKFQNLTVFVVGDIMLDTYIWGKVERISPEAPVPVVRVQKREARLGGAANVALNIQALGAEAKLFSVIGNDFEGNELIQIIAKNGLTKNAILQSDNRPTTVKQRIIASSQHIVRIDSETEENITLEEQNWLLEVIKNQDKKPDIIIFEDYDKGVLGKPLIQAIITWAKQHQIPTITDPKKRNFLDYQGVTLFKPNLKELKEGLKIDLDTSSASTIQKTIESARKQLGVEGILLTLSEKGVFIDFQEESHLVSAHIRQIADVSGAGDTVVSIAALCLALNLTPKEIAFLSNLGGGLVCESVGVIPINKQYLFDEVERLRSS